MYKCMHTYAEVRTYTYRHKGTYVRAKYSFSSVSVWHTDLVKDKIIDYYLLYLQDVQFYYHSKTITQIKKYQ